MRFRQILLAENANANQALVDHWHTGDVIEVVAHFLQSRVGEGAPDFLGHDVS